MTLAAVTYAIRRELGDRTARSTRASSRAASGGASLTALTLHADLPHLLSNLVFGALFGYPAARLFGPGVAWFLILAGAGLAYGIDALLHPPQHYLLGASTAVFTALGLIAAYGWRRHLRDWTPWMRNASPLLAGLALLAFTGTGGENTDILAHFAGFAVGTALGALCAGCRCRRRAGPASSGRGARWRSACCRSRGRWRLQLNAMLPHSDACERNKGPILEVLEEAFAGCTHVLEIGSGTGQHAVHFALALPHVVWQPSELPDAMPALRKRIFNEGPSNLRAPVVIDVTAPPWDVRKVDGIFTANTLHIMHWPQVRGFLRRPAGGGEAGRRARDLRAVPLRRDVHVRQQCVLRRDAARARPGLRHPRLRGGRRAGARARDLRSPGTTRCRRTTRRSSGASRPQARARASAPSARGRRSAPASPRLPRSPTASTAGRRPRGRSFRSPRRPARGRASAAAAA